MRWTSTPRNPSSRRAAPTRPSTWAKSRLLLGRPDGHWHGPQAARQQGQPAARVPMAGSGGHHQAVDLPGRCGSFGRRCCLPGWLPVGICRDVVDAAMSRLPPSDDSRVAQVTTRRSISWPPSAPPGAPRAQPFSAVICTYITPREAEGPSVIERCPMMYQLVYDAPLRATRKSVCQCKHLVRRSRRHLDIFNLVRRDEGPTTAAATSS